MSVSALPQQGGVHFDRRDAGRVLRVSAHSESGTVVVSIWREDHCVASHQLSAVEVPQLIQVLATALIPTSGGGRDGLAC